MEAIKIQYFRHQLEKSFRDIFNEQSQIAEERIYQTPELTSRSGALRAALQNPVYSISQSGQGVVAEIKYPKYVRFLDMKRNGNKRIYNRPVWGTMYGEALDNIRYEFRDWLRKNCGQALADSFGQ